MPYDDEENRVPDKEGVRLIGAEEAEQALERDDVAHRRGEGELRFGDRPETPSTEGPRPTIRFPLAADEDPGRVGGARSVSAPAPDLPHWTEPPTGQVPKIFAAEDIEGAADDGGGSWSAFTTGQPRWRGEGPQLEEGFDDFSRLGDDETRVGALASDDRPDPEDFFAFDDGDDVLPVSSAGAAERWDDPEPVPVGGWQEDDEYDDGYAEPVGRTRSISSDPRRAAGRRAAPATGGYQRPPGAGRNVPVAIAVGVGFAAVAVVSFLAGPTFTAALITVVLGAAAAELFNVLRQAGYQPATLLGLAASVALPLAAYNKGEVGIPLVLFLTVTFGLVWYLAGAGGEDRPVIGLSSTLLGVTWVGLLGAFAALMVADVRVGGFGDDGIGVLLVAVLGTVGYDVGGFAVGRNAGTRPLSAASPNKTIEGLLGGVAVAVVATVVAASVIEPFGDVDFIGKVVLGLAVALAATMGDLCESLVKRDLDVKDMGSVLPEHGGFLDRFDSLLFVLPTAYYLARVLLG